jgi:hypothetical protein
MLPQRKPPFARTWPGYIQRASLDVMARKLSPDKVDAAVKARARELRDIDRGQSPFGGGGWAKMGVGNEF